MNFSIIKNNPLFRGIAEHEIEKLLNCLNSYKKNTRRIKPLYEVVKKYKI